MTNLKKKNLWNRFVNYLKNNPQKIEAELKQIVDNKLEFEVSVKGYFSGLSEGDQKIVVDKFQNVLESIENDFVKELEAAGEGSYTELRKELDQLKLQSIDDVPKMSALTKMCMGMIGVNMLIHGHLAAIGPNETPFDNVEDA